MKCDILDKFCTAVLFVMSVILSWSGIIYSTNDPSCFKASGIIISLIGYGMFLWAILRSEKQA